VKEAMRRLGNQLRPKTALPAQLTHGTVAAIDTGTNTISVDLGDPANPSTNVPVLPGYYPTVGDYVLLHKMGPLLIAAGKAGPVTAPASGYKVLQLSTATSDSTTFGGTETDLFVPGIAVVIPADHYFKVSFHWRSVTTDSLGDVIELRIVETGVAQRQAVSLKNPTANIGSEGGSMFYAKLNGGSPLTATFKIKGIRTSGAGTNCKYHADPTYPALLLVEDLGT
jgi:hypothetical protein